MLREVVVSGRPSDVVGVSMSTWAYAWHSMRMTGAHAYEHALMPDAHVA